MTFPLTSANNLAMTYDIAIVGGGIVGASTAMQLARQLGLRIALLEAEKELASHQTGNNSGVIHSGLYYKPGSLKAELCTEGRKRLYRFCEEHQLPFERCGKIVVATRQDELPLLASLYERGVANGLQGIRQITKEEIREREPKIDGIAGIHVPETGIVDYKAVTLAYGREFEDHQGEILLSTKLCGVKRDRNQLVLKTTAGELKSRHLINCAGLQSDRIARMCGFEPGVRIVPFRGEYYEIVPQRRYLVKNLIYPVPDPRFPFLGVHFTRMITGGVEAGPNAVLALKREGYNRWSISLGDVLSYLLYPGFWKMAAKYGWTGLGEIWRSWSKRAFVKALRRLLPELQMTDVVRGGAGVRAQALLPNGSLLDDFHLLQSENMIHVLNAPSPAATASLSIGHKIARLAMDHFQLERNERS